MDADHAWPRRHVLFGVLTTFGVAGCSGAAPTPTVAPTLVQATAAPPPTEPTALPPTVATAPLPTVAATATRQPVTGTGRLLYTRRGNLHLWANGASRQLTSGNDVVWPRWSPDGKRIALVQKGDTFSDLLVVDADGQNATRLTQHKSRQPHLSKEYAVSSIWAGWPTWEPAGKRIVYTADVSADQMALWYVEPGVAQPRQLQATADLGSNVECPVFSPDGKTLVFGLSHLSPMQLWALDVASGSKGPMTDGKVAVYDPAWAPSGTALAAVVSEAGRSAIYLFSDDARQRQPLVTKPVCRAPAWSPDGRQMGFIGEEDGRFDVYLADLRTGAGGQISLGDVRRLTNDGDVDAPSGLSWTG